MAIDDGILFSVMCTRSPDDRFHVGDKYDIYYRINKYFTGFYISYTDSNGKEFDFSKMFNLKNLDNINVAFLEWYEKCRWERYAFKLIRNTYSVELL